MNIYETTFIIRQDIPHAEVVKLTQNIISLIEKLGGKLHKKEYWGLRRLAYRIKKNLKGHYVMLLVEMPGDTVKELNRQYGMREEIMRFLTIRTDEIDLNPSMMMQSSTPAGA